MGQAEELFPTGKIVNLVVAVVSFDARVELVPEHEIHQLRKDCRMIKAPGIGLGRSIAQGIGRQRA